MREGVSSLTQSFQDFDNYYKETETKSAQKDVKKPPSISMEVFILLTTIMTLR